MSLIVLIKYLLCPRIMMIMSLINTMFIYLIFYVLDHVDLPDILWSLSCLSTWYSMIFDMFIYLIFYDLEHFHLPDILWSLPCWSTWYSMSLIMLIYLIFYVLDHADDPPQRLIVQAVSVVRHDLPAFPGAQRSLDTEGHLLQQGQKGLNSQPRSKRVKQGQPRAKRVKQGQPSNLFF